MKPAPFVYHRPADLAGALALLAELGDDAKLLAGGVSLVPAMNMRLARPAHVIDIQRLPGLSGVRAEGGFLHVGALTRHHQLVDDPLVAEQAPLLAEAVAHIGHAAIRNRGTIGGSLAHADPAAELPTALAALDGAVRAVSARGERRVDAGELFLAPFTTSLSGDELVTEVIIPVGPAGSGWAFVEFARRKGDFAIVAVAAGLGFGGGAGGVPPGQGPGGRPAAMARIAVGGAGPRPARIEQAEAALVGGPASDERIAAAAEVVAMSIEPDGDVHATAAYRRHLARELTIEALKLARVRAGGGAPHGEQR